MGKWFPRIYDTVMNPLEQTKFKKIRKALLANAVGRVLEIGSGSGVNFPYYKNATRVDAIEPNPMMMQRGMENMEKAAIPIDTYEAKAEELPFADNTFDSVVATLVFCTIPDPLKALAEIRRVSKPGAVVLFFEHVRMDQPVLGRTQDILTPGWKSVCDGCHLNRDTLGLIRQSGLSVHRLNAYYKGLFLRIRCINVKEA